MDDGVVPRTRNLRPRKPYVDPFAQPRRSVRRARARLSAADFYVLDNEEDGDWNGATDDEVGDDEVVELGVSSRRSHRSHRRASGRRSTPRATPEPAPKKRARKPKILLPEDVPFREPVQPQPGPDPEDIVHAPSVAFIAIFVATFPTLFDDIGRLPSPQDLEAGLQAPEPTELVDFIFRRVLGCVLNRKKEIEVGRYASALSELHAQRNALGMGPWFPPLQWKSKGNAFAELQWSDRLELLHVLVHWSLSASDRVRQLLRQLDDDAANPWIGADDKGNHYYIVGFDPVAEGAEEHTQFRVYKESNRLLQTVKWEPVASSAAEVQAFLDSHIKRPLDEQQQETDGTHARTEADDTSAEAGTEQAETVVEPPTEADGENHSIDEDDGTKADTADAEEAPGQQDKPELGSEVEPEPEPEVEPEPVEYDLPQSVVDTLLHFLPAMHRSEVVTAERLHKEAKRARRRHDIMWQAENISNGGGRYAGRTRGRKINYAELLRDTVEDDEDDLPRKRRLRQRDSNYEWREPEPETRQQRHERIMAERAAERAVWSSHEVSVEPTPDETPSSSKNDNEAAEPETHVGNGGEADQSVVASPSVDDHHDEPHDGLPVEQAVATSGGIGPSHQRADVSPQQPSGINQPFGLDPYRQGGTTYQAVPYHASATTTQPSTATQPVPATQPVTATRPTAAARPSDAARPAAVSASPAAAYPRAVSHLESAQFGYQSPGHLPQPHYQPAGHQLNGVNGQFSGAGGTPHYSAADTYLPQQAVMPSSAFVPGYSRPVGETAREPQFQEGQTWPVFNTAATTTPGSQNSIPVPLRHDFAPLGSSAVAQPGAATAQPASAQHGSTYNAHQAFVPNPAAAPAESASRTD